MAYFGAQFFQARYWEADYWNVTGGAPPTPPAPVAAPDYRIPRRPKRIILPDGRTVRPKSDREYRDIIGRILAEHAPELVEIVEVEAPRPKRRTAKNAGKRIEYRYEPNSEVLSRIAAMDAEVFDMLHWQSILMAKQSADDDAIAAIIMLIA